MLLRWRLSRLERDMTLPHGFRGPSEWELEGGRPYTTEDRAFQHSQDHKVSVCRNQGVLTGPGVVGGNREWWGLWGLESGHRST